ncbi:MAG: arsenate reductase (glutaredoxin) [Gammaproteobacteria bacterium]
MKPTIYHNPRCSKSRATLKLLEDHGHTPEVIEYLNTPPSVAELKHILKLLDLSPRELLRRNESAYQEAGLDDDSLNNSAIIRIMVAHPVLIERPIVICGDKAVIGRPPENVLAII